MGRTVNIGDNINEKVTTVEVRDSDGEFYRITVLNGSTDILTLQRLDEDGDFINSVIFMREDIDKLIQLFQAAKQYNI